MAQIQVRVDDASVRDLLSRLASRSSDLRPVMRTIGEIVRDRAWESFRTGTSPAGVPWKRSLRAKISGGKTLVDTTILKNSIHVRPEKDRVTVGTPIKYAAVHQFGAKKGSFGIVQAKVKAHARRTKSGKMAQVRAHTRKQSLPWGNIPDRPYLGVSVRDMADIREVVFDYLLRSPK